MIALAQSIARAFPANSLQFNIVRHVLTFILAALFVAFLRAVDGVDMSWAFF
jgi:hypothetical protein